MNDDDCYRCGCSFDAHDHYRGLHCSVCDCPWFKAPTRWRILLGRVTGRRPYTKTVAGAKRA